MTNEEAARYLIMPVMSSTDLGEEVSKQLEAYTMARDALFNSSVGGATLMGQGWICPVCGNVNAPWVASCPCNGEPKTKTTSSYHTDGYVYPEEYEKWDKFIKD